MGSGNYDIYGQQVSGGGARLDNPQTGADETAAEVAFAISSASSSTIQIQGRSRSQRRISGPSEAELDLP